MRHVYTFTSDKKDKTYKAPFYSQNTLFYFRTEGQKQSSLTVKALSKKVVIKKTISYLGNDIYKIVEKYPNSIYGFFTWVDTYKRKYLFKDSFIHSKFLVI